MNLGGVCGHSSIPPNGSNNDKAHVEDLSWKRKAPRSQHREQVALPPWWWQVGPWTLPQGLCDGASSEASL